MRFVAPLAPSRAVMSCAPLFSTQTSSCAGLYATWPCGARPTATVMCSWRCSIVVDMSGLLRRDVASGVHTRAVEVGEREREEEHEEQPAGQVAQVLAAERG